MRLKYKRYFIILIFIILVTIAGISLNIATASDRPPIQIVSSIKDVPVLELKKALSVLKLKASIGKRLFQAVPDS